MTPLRLVALAQLRLGLALAQHALENFGPDAPLDAHQVEQLSRLHHAVADWHAFVDGLLGATR